MLNSSTRDSNENMTLKRMNRHLTWRIFELRNVFTPFATEYRCWHFRDRNAKVEFTEIYIFGIRVARWRL